MNIGKEFVLLFSVLFLPGMISQVAGVDPGSFNHVLYHLELLAVAIPQILLVVTISGLVVPGSPAHFGWKRPVPSDAIVAVMALVAVWIVVSLLSLIASVIPGAEHGTVDWQFSTPALLPAAFVSTLAIGYREEIFFRAYLANRASLAGTDQRLALAAGSLLFASGHLYQGIMGFVIACAIGLVFSAFYLRTRSLHGIAWAHGLYNFIVLLLPSAL